jgi:hypothetical protein
MNDRPHEHSGSQREPAPTPRAGDQPAAEADQRVGGERGERDTASSTPEDSELGAPGHASASQDTGSQEGGRRFTWRGRGPLVALAAGIVALSGVGGYALGNAGSTTADQVGLVGNQTHGNGQLPGGGMPGGGRTGGEQGELQGVPPWGQDGDGDGHGWGHHGWGPGTPPDGDQMTPPDGSYPGTTPNGTTSQGRET